MLEIGVTTNLCKTIENLLKLFNLFCFTGCTFKADDLAISSTKSGRLALTAQTVNFDIPT